MALSGALHGRLTLVRRLLGPPVPPPVCGVTALINTTTIKQILYIICNDKTVIYILNIYEIQTATKTYMSNLVRTTRF